ncbi:Protein kinase, putative [Hondaea fermentalgiana]|uniref:Protein kinase, putative n=1 Tax=Hondaea fermentalgiana TaxID=2315210 RepID=A0A2R5GFK5_9STRA|nr:Protein kinase, putative [Hondaea fermentalgiana]|eukprot:GBG29706.1 Protein kinase, putative [Hondaea fermentalgiana]
MGCTNSKEDGAAGAQSRESKQFEVPGQQHQQQKQKQASTAKKNGSPAKLANGASAAVVTTTGVNGLNALNAEKQDIKDLVEKESFHSVYDLGDTLGRGNYSVVKKATRKTDPSTVYAVKCIKESSLTHEDREALKVETTILKGIDSPHIVKLLGFYHEPSEKLFYIVMEFVGGGELFDRIIAKEYYSEADAQKLVRTIADAIKYCHDRGVVHRDLKPENILLTSKDDDDSIKIADFGFAKQYDTSSDDALSTSCGTPGYVAPEILNGQKYGKEVDMWSFGVIIYILLCGYPPFHHENQRELFRQIRSANFKFDEEYWSEVSNSAKDLVSKLLIVDRTKRLTIDQLLEHPWLVDKAKDTNLTDTQQKLKEEVAKRKFKAAAQAIILGNRLQKVTKLGSAGSGANASDNSNSSPVAPDVETTAAPKDENGSGKTIGSEGTANGVTDATPAAAPEPAPAVAPVQTSS